MSVTIEAPEVLKTMSTHVALVLPKGCKPSKVISKDKTRPVLCGVGLHVEGGDLYAVATDSYALVMIPLPGEFTGEELTALHGVIIPADAVKVWEKGKMLQVRPAYTAEGISHPVTITVEGVSYPGVEGQFPKVGELIPDGYGVDTLGAIALNPKLLEGVAQGLGAKQGVQLDFIAPTRPIRVTDRSTNAVKGCKAIVMPIRMKD
jgi:DNA polymerase III sliding clamp (beta) subunit (PCNA family)